MKNLFHFWISNNRARLLKNCKRNNLATTRDQLNLMNWIKWYLKRCPYSPLLPPQAVAIRVMIRLTGQFFAHKKPLKVMFPLSFRLVLILSLTHTDLFFFALIVKKSYYCNYLFNMVQIKLSLLFILVTAAIAPILALPLPTDNEDPERRPKRQKTIPG